MEVNFMEIPSFDDFMDALKNDHCDKFEGIAINDSLPNKDLMQHITESAVAIAVQHNFHLLKKYHEWIISKLWSCRAALAFVGAVLYCLDLS
jgi:hypothetical protein